MTLSAQVKKLFENPDALVFERYKAMRVVFVGVTFILFLNLFFLLGNINIEIFSVTFEYALYAHIGIFCLLIYYWATHFFMSKLPTWSKYVLISTLACIFIFIFLTLSGVIDYFITLIKNV